MLLAVNFSCATYPGSNDLIIKKRLNAIESSHFVSGAWEKRKNQNVNCKLVPLEASGGFERTRTTRNNQD